MELTQKKPSLISWVLFFACISFPYLYMSNKLGFYDDDWILDISWGYKTSAYLKNFCNFDRVNMFYFYNSIGKFLGESPLLWHLAIYASLLLFGYLVYRLINKLKYFDNDTALAIAGISTLYPCAIMYYSAISYLPFSLFLIFFVSSLLLTVGTYKNRKIQVAFLILSGILTTFHIIQIEHFLGLELSRILIVYAFLQMRSDEENKLFNFKLIKQSFYLNIPNYIGIFSYIFWRLFIFHTIRRETDQVSLAKAIFSHPVKAIAERVPKMINDMFLGTLGSYFHIFSSDLFNFRYKPGFMSLLFISGCIILMVFFRKRLFQSEIENKFITANKKFHLRLIAIFTLAIACCMIPEWFIDKHIALDSANSRFSFALALPGTLIFVLLLSTILNTKVLKYTLWIYLAVSSSFFYRTFLIRQARWNNQKMMYSQIMWRYPNLPIGTMITADGKDIPNFDNGQVLNLIYGHSANPNNLNYMSHIWWHPDYSKEDSATMKVHFNYVPEKQIVMSYEDGKCVKFGKNNGPFLNGTTPGYMNYLLHTTLAPDSIGKIGNPGKWPSKIFGGTVPKLCYCYYFQRAAYFNSIKQFRSTDSLFSDLILKRKKMELPVDLAEWMPFINSSLVLKGEAATRLSFEKILSAEDLESLHKIYEITIQDKKSLTLSGY